MQFDSVYTVYYCVYCVCVCMSVCVSYAFVIRDSLSGETVEIDSFEEKSAVESSFGHLSVLHDEVIDRLQQNHRVLRALYKVCHILHILPYSSMYSVCVMLI